MILFLFACVVVLFAVRAFADDPRWVYIIIIIIIIVVFLHGLGRLTCSGFDALPSFPGASTVSSSSRSVVDGVFRQSGVVHSVKVVDPVLFVLSLIWALIFWFCTCC